jgi:type VI secretion system secreted protein Hcp
MEVISMSQSDCFLKIVTTRAGALKGESQDSDLAGWIALNEWSWGAESSQSLVASGRTQARSFDFSCTIDGATPAMFSTLVTNDVVKVATLNMRRAGGGKIGPKSQNFLTIELKKARLTSLCLSHSAGELLPVVRGSLYFEEIELVYKPQGSDGGSSMGASSFQWQISTKG